MEKYTMEEIMRGEKYNIESDIFMEVLGWIEQKADAKTIREQVNTIYVMVGITKKTHRLMER